MKTEDTAAIEEFREMYGDKAADALVQYLTKKRKDLTASEVLADDGAFERFSNWAYTKLGIDVYENFAKHDVGGFFKRSNVEGFRKMRPGVDPNYNYFLRDIDNESKEVHESDDGISGLDDREIAKLIASKFEEITGAPVSDIFNVASDDPIFDQEMVDKTFPSIKKWLEDHGIFKNRQDDILYELDDVLSSNHIGESINPDDKVTLTLGQIKRMIKEYKEHNIVKEEDDDDYEVCANCGAEIDPCDAYYVDASQPYCSEECLNAAGYTMDDVLDDIQIDSYDSMGEAKGDKKSAGPTLKEADREVEKALKSIGATKIDRLDPKEEAKMVYKKNAGPEIVQYDLWLYKNPAKPKKGWSMIDHGSRISLSLYFGTLGKDDTLMFHGHLGYSNGVATSNAFSNAPRGMWYNFKYDSSKAQEFKSWMNTIVGGRGEEFYPCTQEMLHDIVEGVKDLQFYGNEFEDALKKARFTEIAWRKLCARTQKMFNVPNMIGEDVLSQNVKDIKDEDISKVYDELKKTGKTDDEIGKVIGGIISTKQESTHSLSRLDNVIVETWDATDAHTYWNGNGKYQDIANRLSGIPADKLIEKFKIPYATASKFDRDRIQYYRFFNDGDTPTILKKDITDKYGKFPAHCDMNNDELFNFIAPRLEALIDADLKLVKPYVDKVQDEDTSIEETAVFKKQLIIGDNNDGTITIMLTSQPSENDKKMLRTLAGDENMDYKKDPEYSYWYASIKGKTPKEAEEQISKSFPDYAIEIDNDQDQIA